MAGLFVTVTLTVKVTATETSRMEFKTLTFPPSLVPKDLQIRRLLVKVLGYQNIQFPGYW